MSGMDVKPPPITMQEEDVNQAPLSTEQATEEVTKVAPGAKTDSALLLESLQEEREKRRQAEQLAKEREDELLALKTKPEEDVFSDEGKALLTRISKLESQILTREERDALQNVQSKFPQIKDKQAEFEQFRRENPGMKIETQAKAFVVENDLYEAPKQRMGLERTSGGGRVPQQTGMSEEDKSKLMMENPRKFRDMLKSGQIK